MFILPGIVFVLNLLVNCVYLQKSSMVQSLDPQTFSLVCTMNFGLKQIPAMNECTVFTLICTFPFSPFLSSLIDSILQNSRGAKKNKK